MAVNQLLIDIPVSFQITSDEGSIIVALLAEGLRNGRSVRLQFLRPRVNVNVNTMEKELPYEKTVELISHIKQLFPEPDVVTLGMIDFIVGVVYSHNTAKNYRDGNLIVMLPDNKHYDVNLEGDYPDIISRLVLLPGTRKGGRKGGSLNKSLLHDLQTLEENGDVNEATRRKIKSLQKEIRKTMEKETPIPDDLSRD